MKKLIFITMLIVAMAAPVMAAPIGLTAYNNAPAVVPVVVTVLPAVEIQVPPNIPVTLTQNTNYWEGDEECTFATNFDAVITATIAGTGVPTAQCYCGWDGTVYGQVEDLDWDWVVNGNVGTQNLYARIHDTGGDLSLLLQEGTETELATITLTVSVQ